MTVVAAATEEASESLTSVMMLGLEEPSALSECLITVGCELKVPESPDCLPRFVDTSLASGAFFCCSIPFVRGWYQVSRIPQAHTSVSAVSEVVRSAERAWERTGRDQEKSQV